MREGIEADPTRLDDAAQRMGEHGTDLSAAIQRLTERGSAAAAWRDDGLIAPFVDIYSGCVHEAARALSAVSRTVRSTGHGMHDTAASLVEADAAARRVLGPDEVAP
ncbi:hypothetical protein FE391_17035 [Nonomuraea sp. KC401]|uniref:hypothetical protein n=1 Tax=unclassified Nonomuraea TaxID=2593643 RepID=UPI0010FEDB50|nr:MULTISPECIES: hypothetical protein [unclassified Nonomuraea]NBE95310.1 hypothetical protein [Nonomuraea sp. K271]TLF72405.1 hypothetical protein FE391_17035 [Nonomuraea sp. KC401]